MHQKREIGYNDYIPDPAMTQAVLTNFADNCWQAALTQNQLADLKHHVSTAVGQPADVVDQDVMTVGQLDLLDALPEDLPADFDQLGAWSASQFAADCCWQVACVIDPSAGLRD